MDLLPITLGVTRRVISKRQRSADGPSLSSGAGSSGAASPSASRKVPPDIKSRILERDSMTCRFCGFESQKYQEVHFLNRDTADTSDKNLVTACIFCHQCFSLDEVSAMSSGVLIWLPEIEQGDLHHIMRAVYIARISQGPVADAARRSLDALMARREEAKRRISTDNPYILSVILKDYLSDNHYMMREAKLKGLRLLPLDRRLIKEAELEFNQFPQILAYWRSKNGPFGARTPPQWPGLRQELFAQAG